MERLTARQAIKHADGTSHIVTYCHGHRYGPAAFPDKYGTSNPQEYENYCEMVDRLAAYEDIGTVEDFQRLVAAQSLDVQLAKARHYARLLKEGLSDEEMTDSEKIEFVIGFSDMILQTTKEDTANDK